MSLMLPALEAGVAVARTLDEVEYNSRVRFRSGPVESWTEGIYRGRKADSLRIALPGNVMATTFPVSNVDELEFGQSRYRFVRRSAIVGAVMGAGMGVVMAAAAVSDDDFLLADPGPPVYLLFAGFMAGVGAGAGALSAVIVGIVAGDSWTPVYVGRSRAGGSSSTRVGYRRRF